jgi:hypothetical protein
MYQPLIYITSVIRLKSTCFILQSKIKHLDIKINDFYMYKSKLEESSNKMESFILSNTEKERQAVERAQIESGLLED